MTARISRNGRFYRFFPHPRKFPVSAPPKLLVDTPCEQAVQSHFLYVISVFSNFGALYVVCAYKSHA